MLNFYVLSYLAKYSSFIEKCGCLLTLALFFYEFKTNLKYLNNFYAKIT